MKIKETKSYTVKYDDSIDFQCTAKLSVGGRWPSLLHEAKKIEYTGFKTS